MSAAAGDQERASGAHDGAGPLVGAIEAGGSKFVCVAGTGPGDIRAEVRVPTTTPAETITRALDFFAGHAQAMPIEAIGIASFGPLDRDPHSPTWGFITRTPKPGWTDVDLAGPFRRSFGVPVGFDTDVNGAALGEHRWGAACGVSTFVYVTVGTGIGGGGLVNGVPMRGLTHAEMGHMRVPRDPRDDFAGLCPFHSDCLEGLASGPAIQARWRCAPEELPAEHPAWALEARYLASGLANIVTILSPERIILGGGVMRQAQLFALIRRDLLTALGGYVRAQAILDGIDDYVVPPGLGERTGVLGALALAHRRLDVSNGQNI